MSPADMEAAFVKWQPVLNEISFPGFVFKLVTDGPHAFLLRATFVAADGSVQTTRKWRLSHVMAKSEFVQTAMKLVLTALEHEARERFLYRGQAVFGPHFDVEALHELAAAGRFDGRGAP